jgi:hypothetical protein
VAPATGLTAPDATTATPAAGLVPGGTQETIMRTGYAAADNNPAGSTTISQPVIHSKAGGTCTNSDPTTFASPGSAGSTEFPKGERVYFPDLQCYGISEDSGATKESVKHIDLWSGNQAKSITDKCESDITGSTTIIVNPPSNEPVNPGALTTASGCHFPAGFSSGGSSGGGKKHHKKKKSDN